MFSLVQGWPNFWWDWENFSSTPTKVACRASQNRLKTNGLSAVRPAVLKPLRTATWAKRLRKTVMTGLTAKIERTLGESFFPPKDAAAFELCDRHSRREWREHLSGVKLAFVTLPSDPPSQNVRKVFKMCGLWRSKQEHERGATRWRVNFSEKLISNSGGRSGCSRAALNTAFWEKKSLRLILKVPYYIYF